MKIHAIQRAAVDIYLKLARLPLDTAISMFPDGGTGMRPAARAAVDQADAGMRAIVTVVLGDPILAADGTRRRRNGVRQQRHNVQAHETEEPRARHSTKQQERAEHQRGRTRQATTALAEKAAPAGQPAAPAETTSSASRPTAASGTRAAAIAGTAGRTAARTAGSGTPGRAPDIVTAEQQAPPALADQPSSEPSHEEIAARAYELYQRGVPGDAHSHWEAAKRELTSASR